MGVLRQVPLSLRERGRRLPVQPLATLHAEAVTSEVVVTARRTHKPSRGIGLQPALVFAPVPDPILGAEHPSPSLTVEHGEVAHRDAKRARLQRADAPLFDQYFVSGLCFGKWIDSH